MKPVHDGVGPLGAALLVMSASLQSLRRAMQRSRTFRRSFSA